MVYGGGGITPDVFVPLQSLKDNEFYYQLLNKSVLFKYSFDYTDNNRQNITDKHPDSQSFIKNFKVSEKMMNDILAEAEKNNIPYNEEQYLSVKEEIRTLMKAYIGRNLYDNDCFYPIYHQIDDEVQKALEIIKQ